MVLSLRFPTQSNTGVRVLSSGLGSREEQATYGVLDDGLVAGVHFDNAVGFALLLSLVEGAHTNGYLY